MMRRPVALALLALAAAGCTAQPDDPAAVTADEARQLNEAAEMLDANSVSAGALDDDAESNDADD